MKKRATLQLLIISLFIIGYLHFQFFTFSYHAPYVQFSFPSIWGGDSVHYLLTTMSLIDDYTFNSGPHYYYLKYPDGIHSSTRQFTGMDINYHASYINKKTKYIAGFYDVYDLKDERYDLSSNWRKYNLTEYKAYIIHPVGLPLLAALFLFPFRHSQTMDTWAALLSGIFALLGFFYLYKLLSHYDPEHALFITTIIGFATPLWPYARSFFTEAYTWPLITISFYLILVKKNYIIPGILLAATFLMKYPFAILILIFSIYIFILKKDVKPVFLFLIPFFLSCCFLFSYYFIIYGTPFYMPQTYAFINPFIGLYSFFFHKWYGLFPFSPVLFFSFFGVKSIFQKYRKEAIFFFLCFLPLLFLLANFDAGCCSGAQYSSRYLVPVMPFFAILLLFGYKRIETIPALKILFICLLILSFLITLQSFLFPQYAMMRPASAWSTFQTTLSLPS